MLHFLSGLRNPRKCIERIYLFNVVLQIKPHLFRHINIKVA